MLFSAQVEATFADPGPRLQAVGDGTRPCHLAPDLSPSVRTLTTGFPGAVCTRLTFQGQMCLTAMINSI